MSNDIQTQLEDYFTNHLPSGMEYCSVDSWELIKEGKDSSIYEVELDYKTSENEHEYRTEKVKISKDGDVSVNEGLEAKDRPHQWYIVRREIDPRSKTNATDYMAYPPLETVEGQTDWMTKSEVEKWAKKKYGYGKTVSKNRAGRTIFINDPYNESLQRKNMDTKINIRESLNRYDLRTDNKYDLRNLYDSCNMNDKEKRTIAEMIYNNARANALYEALMNKFEGKPLVEAWVPAQYGFSQKKIPVHEFIELLEDHTQGKIEGDKNCRYIAVTMDSSVSHHGYEGVLFTDSLDEAKRFADEENHSKLADGPWEYSLPYRVFTVVYDTIDIYPEVIYPNVELNGSGFPNKKEDYKKYTYRFYKLSNEESKELVDKYAKGELKTDDEILEWLRNHGVSGRTAEENLYDLKKIFKNESTNESLKESKASPYQNISDKDVRNLEKELKKAKDSKRKSFLQATLNKYKKELKSSGKLHESYNKPIEESGYLDYSETGNPSWHDDYDYDEDSGYSPDLPEKYTLVGVDGNAYAIMGYTANALKREGLRDLVDQMYKEATSGDYDNLLVVCMKYVDMANEAAYNKDESLNESDEDSLDKYYKVSYSFDTGNAESGPVVGNDFDIIKAKSEEDACRKFEASCSDEGHCGCTAVEATPEQVAEYESKFGPIEESLNEGVHADDELTRQLVELLKTILAGDNLASIGAMEDLLDFMEDLPVGTIIDLPQQYVIQQIRKQGDDSYSYQFDGMGEVYKSRKIDRADAQEMILEWAERSGPETLRIMSESLNEAADREVDRKGFVSLIKYGVFDPGGNYAVLRDGNFVYKFWADDDEEAKEMFRNNLKESLYESESEKDFWSELDEIAGEYLSGKISEDTFGDKYEKLANMYLSKGGEEAKRLAWQIAGANSADTYLNMDDPTAEDFDRCMESANTEAKILDKYGFSNYAEMIRRDMREAEEEQEKEQEDSEY